jgi:predicted metalloprotease with PDZ domain
MRRHLGLRGALLAALVFVPALARPARAQVRYKVSLADRAAHMFHVTMTVPNVQGHLAVKMPAWNATYLMRDFAERVEDVRASAAGKPLPVWALTGYSWRITGSGTIQIRYRVYWNSTGPFSSQLDNQQAFINFADILFYAPSRRQDTSEVEFTGVPAGWRIAVELPKAAQCPAQACYVAGNYDLLVDAPAEAGKFTEFRFVENGAHLRVVMDAMGGAKWNQAQLEEWLRKIVKYETGMMRVVPFKQYLFIYHIGPGAGGGGMEHSNGTAIAVPEFSEIPAITAHEFFHLWNVKRIRPQSLTPYDYEHPMWTRSLWFAEGVTSTYAAYTMVRTGLWAPEQYYAHLGQLITALESRPARRWQSVEESSLDTWYGKYPFYNRPERSISYYNKGELVGVLLDIRIRQVTGNQKSLNSVMRYMYAQYPAKHRFYDGTAAIEAAVNHVAGRDLDGFFQRYVAGTAPIPWNKMLGRAGLDVTSKTMQVADPGFRWRSTAGGAAVVTEVTPGGPAAKAGLEVGDVVISSEGVPLPPYAPFWIRQERPGATVELQVARNGRVMTMPLTFGSRSQMVYQVAPIANPSPEQKRILEGLLHAGTR